jgi:hypothetical protein
MEPIADMAALKPVVESLVKKGLMIELTAAGRGQVVSHGLYKERELTELRTRFANYVPPAGSSDDVGGAAGMAGSAPPRVTGTAGAAVAAATGQRNTPPGVTADEFAELSVDVAELRAEVARLKDQVQTLESRLQSVLG